jgi:hypothetical protein
MIFFPILLASFSSTSSSPSFLSRNRGEREKRREEKRLNRHNHIYIDHYPLLLFTQLLDRRRIMINGSALTAAAAVAVAFPGRRFQQTSR